MRSNPLRICIPVVILALSGCKPADAPGSRPLPVKLGSVLSATHPTVQSLKFFEKRLEELSGGRFDVIVFPASQLGSQDNMIDGCRTGDVQLAQVSTATLAEYVPLANALSMPFIFRSPEHQARVLDGPAGSMLDERSQAIGVEVIGFLDSGTRNITTKKGPIRRPEDLRGLKIRVMDSKLMVETVNALGASAVAMNQGEVFTALQQGVIDGWENNPQTIVDFRMYETGCTHFAWTRHLAIPDVLIASKAWLDGLTEEQRGWILAAGKETVQMQRALWRTETEKALATMMEKGMRINEVDATAFQSRVDAIYKEYNERNGESFRALCELIRTTQ